MFRATATVTGSIALVVMGMGMTAPLYTDPSRTDDLIAPMEEGVPSFNATQYSDPPVSTPVPVAERYTKYTAKLTVSFVTLLTATEVIVGTTRVAVGDDVRKIEIKGTEGAEVGNKRLAGASN